MVIWKYLDSCSMLTQLGDYLKKCHADYCLCESTVWLQLRFKLLLSTINNKG